MHLCVSAAFSAVTMQLSMTSRQMCMSQQQCDERLRYCPLVLSSSTTVHIGGQILSFSTVLKYYSASWWSDMYDMVMKMSTNRLLCEQLLLRGTVCQ
jgi:hypothetical protein